MPSTVIKAFTYLEYSSTLRITFVSGTVYDYFSVSADVFDSFRTAISKGTYFNNNVKGNYRFEKVNG